MLRDAHGVVAPKNEWREISGGSKSGQDGPELLGCIALTHSYYSPLIYYVVLCDVSMFFVNYLPTIRCNNT